MTLVDGFASPLPLQAMLVVGKPTIQKLHVITTNIAL